MRPRTLLRIFLVVTALLLPSSLVGVATATTTGPADPAEAAPTTPSARLGAAASPGAAHRGLTGPALLGAAGPVVWHVPITAPGQVRDLERAGFDVARSTDDNALVIGDLGVAGRLRALGYRPTGFGDLYREPATPRRSAAAGTYYGGYHTVAAHEQHLDDVAREHPDLATVHDIGDSWLRTRGWGGHDIKAVCLTRKEQGDCARTPDAAKPRFTLVAQVHAREISTGELAWRWIDHLVGGYGTDTEVTDLLDSTEVWVVPIANPDGVDVVVSGGNHPRMQRKNLDSDNGTCPASNVGIDLNRNSSYKWGGAGGEPCAESYQGPEPRSEPETVALENLFTSIYPRQRGTDDSDPAPAGARGVMLTLHSFGDYIILPWGWTDLTAPNDAQLRALGERMAAHNGYTVGTNAETVGYETPGTTDDFTYGVLGVASATFEIGSAWGECGGFFPRYSCVDSEFWPENRGAFMVAAQAAAAPYALDRSHPAAGTRSAGGSGDDPAVTRAAG
ncbi:M14 family zinc carboxypeptidase [Goodfellowiella coeruleoviolacea]|nr:M14 family zinc carboxypeptidase [Goodfellowiella coeruleoviolacea]